MYSLKKTVRKADAVGDGHLSDNLQQRAPYSFIQAMPPAYTYSIYTYVYIQWYNMTSHMKAPGKAW